MYPRNVSFVRLYCGSAALSVLRNINGIFFANAEAESPPISMHTDSSRASARRTKEHKVADLFDSSMSGYSDVFRGD
jgi:hypothetical protein